MRRLARNMEQTSSSLQSSKWLAGARVIYEAVRTRRNAVGKDTKSFADWISLQHYSSAVDIGMLATRAPRSYSLTSVYQFSVT